MTKRRGLIRRAEWMICYNCCDLTSRMNWRRSRCRARSIAQRTTARHALPRSRQGKGSVKALVPSQFIHSAKDRDRIHRRVERLSSEFTVRAFDAEEDSLRLSPICIRAEVNFLCGFKRRVSRIEVTPRFFADVNEIGLHLARPFYAA